MTWLIRARFRLPSSDDVGSCAGFLDAGNDERGLALRGGGRPKKRQGTKSRQVWCGGAERYGELNFAPAMEVGAMLEQGLDGCAQGGWKRVMGVEVVAWIVSTSDRLVDRRNWAERERRRRGASAWE
jgi:hypothetical protein